MKTIKMSGKEFRLYFKYKQSFKVIQGFNNVPLSGKKLEPSSVRYIDKTVTATACLENVDDPTDYIDASATAMIGDTFVKEEGRVRSLERLVAKVTEQSSRDAINDVYFNRKAYLVNA